MRWQSLLLENCGPPLPGAEEGGTQFPQPRHWPAASEDAAGEWHPRQGVPRRWLPEGQTDEVLPWLMQRSFPPHQSRLPPCQLLLKEKP